MSRASLAAKQAWAKAMLHHPHKVGVAILKADNKRHWLALVSRARAMGFELNEEGLWNADGRRIAGETEAGIYEALDMDPQTALGLRLDHQESLDV